MCGASNITAPICEGAYIHHDRLSPKVEFRLLTIYFEITFEEDYMRLSSSLCLRRLPFSIFGSLSRPV